MVWRGSSQDAGVIARMLHDFNLEFGEPSPGPDVLEARVRDQIETGSRVWLLVGDERPAGLAQIDFRTSIWSEDPIACLEELYVTPDRRDAGMGRCLLTAALDLVRDAGADWIELSTGEDDVVARHLYESVGFVNQVEGRENARSLYYELDLSSR